MVVVRTCCCGCTLAQGTIGTGIVSTVESFLLIGIGAFFLNFRIPENTKYSEHKETIDNYIHAIGITGVVQGTLILSTTVLLFCAVKMKNRYLLLPWLITRAVLLVLSTIACIIFFSQNVYLLVSLVTMLWVALMKYLLLVVISYYQTDMGRIVEQREVWAQELAQPDNPYKSIYPMGTTPPPAGTTVYYPPPNPISTGPKLYPIQTYSYAPPAQAATQPQFV